MADQREFFFNKKLLISLTPIVLILTNLILKGLYISANGLGGDEPFSVYCAQMDVSSIINLLKTGNNPPFYEILLHFWIKLFGIGEAAVRFPSYVFSAITVFFVYKTGKEFYNYRIGTIAGLIFTFSNYHLGFSHEARVYALFALLSSVSMYIFLSIIYKNDDLRRKYTCLLIINLLLIYSHYFSFFLIFIQTIAIFWLLYAEKLKIKYYIIYICVLILFFLPNTYFLWRSFLNSSIHGTWLTSPEDISALYNLLWRFSNQPLTTVFSILVLFAAFIKLILKKALLTIAVGTKIILLWFFFPFFFIFAISFWIPMFLDRYLIFISTAYYLLLAISADYIIEKKYYSFILPFALIGLFIGSFNPNVDNKCHAREAVYKLISLKDKDTKVIVCPPQFILNFSYYYNAAIFKEFDDQDLYSKITRSLKKDSIFALYRIDGFKIKDCKEVIFVDAAADFLYPDNHINASLNQSMRLKDTYKFEGKFVISKYEFKD